MSHYFIIRVSAVNALISAVENRVISSAENLGMSGKLGCRGGASYYYSIVATSTTQGLRQRDICNDAATSIRPRADEIFETNVKIHGGVIGLAFPIQPGALHVGGRIGAQPVIL